MASEQGKNIKYGGLTTLPDDYQSVDGSLAFATNAVSEDGAIKIIPPALSKNLIVQEGDKVYVHSTASYTHYIVAHQTLAERDEDGNIVSGADEVTLYWVDEKSCEENKVYCVTDAENGIDNNPDVEGVELGPVFTIGAYDGKFVDLAFVGNTVILSTSESLQYILWKADDGDYLYLGDSVPRVNMQWGLNLTLGRNVFLDTGITMEVNKGVSAGDSYQPVGVCEYNHPHVTSKDYQFTVTGSGATDENGRLVLRKDVRYRAYQYVTSTKKASPNIHGYRNITYNETQDTWNYSSNDNLCDIPERSKEYKYFTPKRDYKGVFLRVQQRKSSGIVYIEECLDDVTVDAAQIKDDTDDGQNNFTAVMGYMNKFVNEQGKRSDRFVYPFMLRYAVKLYDGTWCNLSSPVLLYPNTGYAPLMKIIRQSKYSDVEMYAFTAGLHYELRPDDSGGFISKDWEDLVLGVGVFVSPGVYPYDQGAYWQAGVSSYDYLYSNNEEQKNSDGTDNGNYINQVKDTNYGIGDFDGATTDGTARASETGDSDEGNDVVTVKCDNSQFGYPNGDTDGDGKPIAEINSIEATVSATNEEGEAYDLNVNDVDVDCTTNNVSVTVTKQKNGNNVVVTLTKDEGANVSGSVIIKTTVGEATYTNTLYVSTIIAGAIMPEYDTGDFTVVDSADAAAVYGYNLAASNGANCSTTVRIAAKKQGEIQDEILNIANFYKIGEIDFDDLTGDGYTGGEIPSVDFEIEEGTLNSLEARETLKEEEVSVDGFQGANLFVYNNRLHVTGGTRSLPAVIASMRQNGKVSLPDGSDGTEISRLIPTDGSGEKYLSAVLIRTDEGTRMVVCRDRSLYMAPWFFYPDTRAYQYIELAPRAFWANELDNEGNATGNVYDCLVYDLKPHDFLNGSYMLRDVGRFCRAVLNDDDTDVDYASAFAEEELDENNENDKVGNINKIYVSDASNPFVFKNAMVCTAGSGQVLALSSAAKALSQGQFGQFPLYAFTDEGIWAMSVGSTGAYETVQPIARDVATNVAAITQLDSCVVFVTARGVMLVEGSNVVCMSDDIDGDFGQFDPRDLEGFHALMRKYLGFGAGDTDSTVGKWAAQSFFDFIKGCKMRYDYIHQRITVYSDDCDMAYVYSLKSKEWLTQLTALQDNVNSYPDAYALREADSITYEEKDEEGNVKTVSVETSELVNLSEYDLDAERGPMLFVTRPLKLDAADIYKTVTDVAQRGYFRQDAKENHVIGTILYGSPDLFHWLMVAQSGGLDSHRIENVHGTPYKYFRLVVVSRLDVREGISGCSVWFETKDTQRMR